MTLRNKTFWTIGVTWLVLMSVLFAVSSRIFMHGFTRVEEREAMERAQRVADHIQDDARRIDTSCWDWAAWDDSCQYLRDRNRRYYEGNLLPQSLVNLHIDFIVYMTRSGRLVFGTGVDRARVGYKPLPRGLIKAVDSLPSLGQHANVHSQAVGIVELPDGPALIASRPIVTSERHGPVRGALVMGRFIDAEELSRISGMTRTPATVYPVFDPSLPQDFRVARSEILRDNRSFSQPTGRDEVSGYTIVNDITGRPALLVRADTRRTIYHQGLVTTRYAMLAVLIAALVFGIVTISLLERVVLRRLLRLSNSVASISRAGDASDRVTVEGSDELALLGDGINRMLVALEQSQVRQREKEDLYRQMALNSSDALFVLDIESGSLQWYGPIDRLLGFDDGEAPRTLAAWEESLHPDDLAAVREQLQHAYNAGEPMAAEYRIRCRNGSYRYFMARGRVHHDAEGRATRFIGACSDITDRRRVEDDLRASEARLSSIVETNADGICIIDREGRFTFANAAAERIYGVSREEITRRTYHDPAWRLTSLDDRPIRYHDLPFVRAIRSRQPVYGMEHVLTRADGERLILSVNAAPLRTDQNEIVAVVASISNVSERKSLEERLAYQAFHDALTGLPNRTMLLDQIGRSFSRSARKGRSVGVLFLDLDNFKLINDSLGHDMGDRLLISVAERIMAALRGGDFAARLGGDEFTVLIEEIRGEGDAITVAERLLEQFQDPVLLGDREVYVSPSIGIAVGEPGVVTPGELLKNADLAMYEAKAGGRARYAVFHSGLNADALRRLELVHDLRGAVERQEFILHFQPKVVLRGGHFYGLEALARWRHPHRGIITPKEFIPLAEETGLIVPLGRWVLRESCLKAREWQRLHPSLASLSISVNLSARQFQNSSLTADVQEILRETGLDPACLILEITETIVMEDAPATIDVLRELKALGVQLAIDDFGTGYSSLSYLRRFPMDFIKIDRSFVDAMGSDPEESVIVSSTISLAHALGLKVIGEGVETRQQAEHLMHMDCDLAQGNYFAEPLGAEAMGRRLIERLGEAAGRLVPDSL